MDNKTHIIEEESEVFGHGISTLLINESILDPIILNNIAIKISYYDNTKSLIFTQFNVKEYIYNKRFKNINISPYINVIKGVKEVELFLKKLGNQCIQKFPEKYRTIYFNNNHINDTQFNEIYELGDPDVDNSYIRIIHDYIFFYMDYYINEIIVKTLDGTVYGCNKISTEISDECNSYNLSWNYLLLKIYIACNNMIRYINSYDVKFDKEFIERSNFE